MTTIQDTPLEKLIPGKTRVRSQKTGVLGTIVKLDPNTRYGPENPVVHIQWDNGKYSMWWWNFFDTVDVMLLQGNHEKSYYDYD